MDRKQIREYWKNLPKERQEHPTREDLIAMGHSAVTPARAHRLKCLECMGGAESEISRCSAPECPSYPWRYGDNPWTDKRQVSEETLERLKGFAAAKKASREVSQAAIQEAQEEGG